MEEFPGYKPSQEEIDKAESMMEWWQRRGTDIREADYGQMTEQERARHRAMVMKGEMYFDAMKAAGFPDKSPEEMLKDIRAGIRQKSKDGRTVDEVLEKAREEFERKYPEGTP